MCPTLDRVCCARLETPDLAVLADLRADAEVRVTVVDGHAWVRWEAGNEEVLRRVLPIRGVELLARREGRWYRPGRHLPEFTVVPPTDGDWMPLSRAVVPAPVSVAPPGRGTLRPARLGLARDDIPRAATALRCRLTDLAAWAETATAARLSGLRAAVDGDRVMLLGQRLPELPGAERFWGDGAYLPLGFRAEPGLSVAAIREALRVAATDVLVLAADGAETIPRDVFRPVTRAGVRLALGGRPA